uniref:Secreted protein n=1 Tax=Oryza glumipatula TaxID=40148 RepID=A0A0D9Y3F5_9ORYZ
MEATVFAPHQVAILALLAVEAEAAAAARRCTGRMAANVMRSISKGGTVMRSKIIELAGMGQKLWLANWHIAQEHNLRRDRVRSWLSDDFVNHVK